MRTVITENEAIMLKNYMEEEEIIKRFKIVPMKVLRDVINKGVAKGISISTIAESVGLAYISVYKLYEKLYKKEKQVKKDDRKIQIDKEVLMSCINLMKGKSKLELAHILGNRISRPISYVAINRILKESGLEL